MILLAASFVVIGVLTWLEGSEIVLENPDFKTSMPIIIGVALSILDYLLGVSMEAVAYYEKVHTYGELNASIATKSIWLQFLNSAVITFSIKLYN